ncbi:tripartite tricarboxylate transporter substrate binding protein [Limnohabitans sp. Rim8]|uniref:Bug family tripartite tricarboxylate transporter substrate binding protein n=1 Tax=Limnohabitans sp. Rim8 TaxID=1100718 RepID=UPI00262A4886|nr:tripartite tricarboxylate transporter substrate binding protein [Limnohabitans sp. Rim8]
MKLNRNHLFLTLFATTLTWSTGTSLAQTPTAWPNKTVKIIMPSLPAGSPDRVTRMVAEKLSVRWGQPVVVEYKPGATTVIGTDFVARAPADGYTLLSTFTSLVQAPALLPKVPWDPERDFTPIVQLIRSEVILLVRSDSPYKTLGEFIAGAKTAKANGAPLNYASFGNASSFHIYGEALKRGAGIDLTHIPYKGEAASIVDLIGGQVVSSFNSIGTAMPHIKSGRVRPLALVGSVRSKVLPEVPTFGEAGVAKLDTSGWFGMLAPAGTPRSIVDKIANDTAQILALPEVTETLRGQGLEPTGLGPDAFARFLHEDLLRWKSLTQELGIKADN